ncbi:phage Gp37/Gp68 family protein [Planotetraspora sp. A-T 1434]|uniref:DUF5131 family protein n=1 Tax=Planotetraspora sp. A-T 1434 TaxID=2979219 RepID=UPI0021BF11CD|nr:phage Gp37/Gp68 family protein [Planotetraspora sp. A-T 1434]MCT9932422.1 phage Gp37/Gp68 family protein [Planotetraspora sp. A-T 1434]
MSDRSSIEWTDATWNPVTGCTKVSPGCDRCYAETFAERWRGTKGHYFENGFDVQLRPDKLDQPLRWKKPRRIFVNSMSDLFHKDVPDDYIARVFALMALTPQHTYQILTKRHGRMRSLLNSGHFVAKVWGEVDKRAPGVGAQAVSMWPSMPLPNVWLGVSVEDQKWADLRIPALLETPAAVRFLSCEPLLGPVDLAKSVPAKPYWHDGIDWVIVGGESGPGARPMHPDWVRSLRDQCQAANVAFFMKQAGAVLAKEWGCSDRKGHDSAEWPEAFPREYPSIPETAGALAVANA